VKKVLVEVFGTKVCLENALGTAELEVEPSVGGVEAEQECIEVSNRFLAQREKTNRMGSILIRGLWRL